MKFLIQINIFIFIWRDKFKLFFNKYFETKNEMYKNKYNSSIQQTHILLAAWEHYC